MDEEKKTLGRAKIYTGSPAADGSAEHIPTGDRRSRRAEAIGTTPKEHLAAEPGRRRKDIETDAKMRRLWVLLGVLIVILVAAIVYEIVLGHATVETGSQRMNQAAQMTEQAADTEEESETVQTDAAESEEETSADDGTAEDGGSTADDGTAEDGGSTADDGTAEDGGNTADDGTEGENGSTLAGIDD